MNDNTLLLRQIHSRFIKPDGHIMDTAFEPRTSDNNRLSVYNMDLINPENSFTHYNSIRGCCSAGVLGVTVAECRNLNLDADSSPSTTNPAHAHINFLNLTDENIMLAARNLCKYANDRGRLYPIESWAV